MSKEEIIKMIEVLDATLKENKEVGIPTKLLVDLRNWWKDVLLRDYGISYERERENLS